MTSRSKVHLHAKADAPSHLKMKVELSPIVEGAARHPPEAELMEVIEIEIEKIIYPRVSIVTEDADTIEVGAEAVTEVEVEVNDEFDLLIMGVHQVEK